MTETNTHESYLKQLRKWKFHIVLVLAVIAIIAIIVFTLITVSNNSTGEDDYIGIETEDQSVQLAVDSMMANPEIRILTLNGSDTRIAGFTPCGDDPSHPIALTQDMSDGGLVDICTSAECVAGQGTPHSVSHYMASDTTEYWYCVHDDGGVWGYKENCINQESIDCDKVKIGSRK